MDFLKSRRIAADTHGTNVLPYAVPEQSRSFEEIQSTMSINGINGQNAASTYIQNADAGRTASANAAQQGARAQQRGTARAADEVTLSDGARSLAAAQEAVKSAPDIRDEKVAAIKQQIETGTYQVSAHVLARKMVDHAYGQTNA
jgi:negative regulator of flagellin synthesis FlgM